MKRLSVSPSAPKRLRRMARSVKRETGVWNLRETARRLGVNQRYVSEALRGIEPKDTTEYLRAVRVKLGYPKHKRKVRSSTTRAPAPEWMVKVKREIEAMHEAGINPSNHTALQAYADGLKSSRRQFLKSALRLMVQGIEQEMKANATPQNLKQTQAALLRLDAMRGAVQVQQHKGSKAHTWLSQKHVAEITALCGETLEGKRDWIVLGLLLGAGLRREELATLTFDALKQQPTKSGRLRDVLEVRGKGAKDRVIPISEKLGNHLREWQEIVGGGMVARSLGMSKQLGESMSAVAIFHLVSKYGERIGVPGLAPHDLRRTYAQLGYEAGVPITQISTLLGHSSVTTTQRYLDLSLDIETTASDFVPLS